MNDRSHNRFHKRIRLPVEEYARQGIVCFVTVVVRNRDAVFADDVLASEVVSVLRLHAKATGAQIHAFCIMPDHVHLLLGPTEGTDVITFVGQFKNLAQRAAWRCGLNGLLWQKSFWDRILRQDEQVLDVVEYVLNNPVRRGLVDDWRKWPYSGSLVWTLE